MTPQRRELIAALRAQAAGIPVVPDFKWDFGFMLETNSCGSVGCALGLGELLGHTDFATIYAGAKVYGLTFDDARRIFYNVENYYGPDEPDVTPAQVADALEAAP
jgi:hypothetical protein